MKARTAATILIGYCGAMLIVSMFMLFYTWYQNNSVTYIQLLGHGWFWLWAISASAAGFMAMAACHVYDELKQGEKDGTDSRRHYKPSTAPDRCACGRWIRKGSVYCLNCIPY